MKAKQVLLTIFLSLFLTCIFAQITVNSNVRQQYDSAYRKLPANIRQNFTSLNIAVVTLHNIDTLNKDQLKPDAYIYHAKKYKVMFCEGSVLSDTFGIVLYPGVNQNSNIDLTHLIVHDTVKTEYDEWIKYDTSFRTNLKREKTNELALSFVTKKFILSDENFTVGRTIYGYADILSEPYYQDNDNFKSGYIIRRLHFRYYFKLIVKQNTIKDY